jgi:hypothetical protein
LRTLTPSQAAIRLGVTDHAVRDMVRAGRLGNLTAAGHHPAAIPYDHVTRVMHERRAEALRRVGDETDFARRIHRDIWPNKHVQPRANGVVNAGDLAAALQVPSGRDVLRTLPGAARMLWGADVLAAAATAVSAGTCRTCMARLSARVHESMPPRDSEPHRILLGNPCTECTKTFEQERRNAREQLNQLHHTEQAYRDRQRLQQFDAQQRQVMAEVRRASAEFARLVKLRKQAGLPPLGGAR